MLITMIRFSLKIRLAVKINTAVYTLLKLTGIVHYSFQLTRREVRQNCTLGAVKYC